MNSKCLRQKSIENKQRGTACLTQQQTLLTLWDRKQMDHSLAVSVLRESRAALECSLVSHAPGCYSAVFKKRTNMTRFVF